MPVTVNFDGTLPEFTDYSMKNRTYRYTESEVLYPFGYGLGYTDFQYDNMEITKKDGGYDVKISVKNTGNMDGTEPVQIYISNAEAVKTSSEDTGDQPIHSLCGFRSVSLKKGESKEVTISVSDSAFDTVLTDGRRVKLPGTYKLYAGSQQPDRRSEALTGRKCLMQEVNL